MAFSARTSGSDDLKTIISAISTLVEEAAFEATEKGISFRGMDPAHVALIDIEWPAGTFEKYECGDDLRFGVRIDEFAKIIKRAGKADSIDLSITDDGRLLVAVGRSRKYRIRLIDNGPSTATPLPKVEYDAKIVVPAAKFEKAVGDIQVISEYLTMGVVAKDGAVEFSGQGDTGDVAMDMGRPDKEGDDDGDSIMEEASAKTDSTGTYSMEYLVPVVKAVSGSASRITCEFSTAKPLKLGCSISGVGRINFYLAPKVAG